MGRGQPAGAGENLLDQCPPHPPSTDLMCACRLRGTCRGTFSLLVLGGLPKPHTLRAPPACWCWRDYCNPKP